MMKHFKSAFALFVMLMVVMSAFGQGIVPKKDEKKNLWGYVNPSTDKWVVKPKYDSASEYAAQPNGKQRALVSLKGAQGFLDESGKPLGAGIVFEKIEPLEGDAMFVTVKGKKGVANYDGVYLVKPEAEAVEQLGNEGWIMTVKGKKGLLKNDGGYLIQPVYTDIDASVPGYFIVNANGKVGLMKRDGSVVIAPKDYTGLAPFKNNLWTVKKGDKAGLMDIVSGSVIVKPEYDAIVDVLLDGKANIAKKGNKYDIINNQDKRGFRLTGYDNLAFSELSDRNALMINSEGGDWIYDATSCNSYPISITVKKVGCFSQTEVKLAEGKYYTQADKNFLEPFLGLRYFESPDGVTDYAYGRYLNDNLYVMENDKRHLFKEGENTPLGTIYNATMSGDVFQLTSGKCVDKDGNLYEITGDNEKYFVMTNLTTGKMRPAMKVWNGVGFIGDIEYDNLKLFDCPIINSSGSVDRKAFFIFNNGNSTLLLNDKGEVVSETEADKPIEIKYFDDYKFVIDNNGNIGLKDGNRIVIDPLYDSIEMQLIGDPDNQTRLTSSLFRVSRDGKMGMYDISQNKIVIPLEKGYKSVGGPFMRWTLNLRFYDSGLCYVQSDELNAEGDDFVRGMWNFNLGKEVLAPSAENKIETLPTGYKGFENNGVAYAPNGSKLSLPASVDVYQAEWANSAPHFFVKLAGLEGRTVEFQITAYAPNGSVYLDRAGRKCIYTFSQTATPTSAIEYGPKVTAYLGDDVHLNPFSKITLKFVLTAKDAKTGASIPVKGEKSVSAWFEREW